MSYDLAVWHSETAMSAKEAQSLYVKLCRSEIPHEQHLAIDAVYAELCQTYPEIVALPEDGLTIVPGPALTTVPAFT